jgi:hypothetical protein
VRISFNYFISDAVCAYLIEAVDLVATHGHRLLGEYRFEPRAGLWQHRGGPAEPPVSLAGLHAAAIGAPGDDQHRLVVGEEALAGYLQYARRLLAARPDQLEDGPTGLSPDLEALRDFHLPANALDGSPNARCAGPGPAES